MLYIQKTINTPKIKFEDGVLSISGRCIPENAIIFYQPLFKYLVEYSLKPYPLTEINISLEYSNSSTNRSLMTIFTLIEKIFENGNNVRVNWYYESGDEFMMDLGNDFKSILRMPFVVEERDLAL